MKHLDRDRKAVEHQMQPGVFQETFKIAMDKTVIESMADATQCMVKLTKA